MTSKEFFTMGIRLFGVWELLRLVDYALEGFDLKAGFYHSSLVTAEATYPLVLAYFAVGLYLIGGAPQIVNFFYPPVSPPATPKDQRDASESGG